jgi:hypothetical protein
MDIEVRSITDGDVEAFRRSLIENFGGDVSDEEGALDRFRDLFETSRTFAGGYAADGRDDHRQRAPHASQARHPSGAHAWPPRRGPRPW